MKGGLYLINNKAMQKPKYDINKYKKKDDKLCKTQWQELAKQTCIDFGVKNPYDKIVFKYAKQSYIFLKKITDDLREQNQRKGDDLKTYGKLLIYKLNEHKMKVKKFPHEIPQEKYTKEYADIFYDIKCKNCGKTLKEGDKFTGTIWKEDGKFNTWFRHHKC